MDGIQCRVCWRIVVRGSGAVRPDGSFTCEKCREIASLDRDCIVVPKHAETVVAKAIVEGKETGVLVVEEIEDAVRRRKMLELVSRPKIVWSNVPAGLPAFIRGMIPPDP